MSSSAKSVRDRPAVEAHNKLARIRIDIVNHANVAVIDLLLVIVLDLHHLIAGGKGPAEPLNLTVAGWVQYRLQFDVE